MKKTKTEQNILTIGLLVLALIFLFTSFSYSHLGRRMALFFGIPVTALLIWILIADNFLKSSGTHLKAKFFESTVREQNDKVEKVKAEEKKVKTSEPKSEWQVLLFIGMFFVLIYFFQFLVAIPIFTFLYLKLFSKESWLMSIGLTVALWLTVYFGFVKALGLQI